MASSQGPTVLVLCEGGKDEKEFLRKYFAAFCPVEASYRASFGASAST